MTFFLARRVLGSSFELHIEDSEGHALRNACNGIIHFVELEDNYDAILRNYVELEVYLFRAIFDEQISVKASYDQHYDIFAEPNRLIMNLLSAARRYIDITHRDVSKQLSSIDVDFKKLVAEIFDGSFSYRIADALRNYSQHAGSSIGLISNKMKWDEDHSLLSQWIEIQLPIEELKSSPKVRLKTREEIQGAHSVPNLGAVLRTYVSQISELHSQLRGQSEQLIKLWEDTVKANIAAYEAGSPDGKSLGMKLLEKDIDNRSGGITVFTAPFDRLARVRRELKAPVKFSNLRASTDPSTAA